MEENRKRYLIELFVITTVIIVVIGLVVQHVSDQRRKSAANRVDSHLEGPGYVVINNPDSLQSVLLSQQYQAVTDTVSNYITSVDPGAQQAYVSKPAVVQADGTVTFSVQPQSPGKAFDVKINRLKYFDRLIIDIPQTDYHNIVRVYGN